MEYPTYSLSERDRRFNIAQDLIRKKGLDGLIVFGANSRQEIEGYFSNEICHDGIVIISPQGNVRLQTRFAGRIAARQDPARAGRDIWIPRTQMGVTPPAFAQALKEEGMSKGRIGTINGPESHNFNAWNAYLHELPDIDWVNVTYDFALATIVKSDEELEAFRWCGEISEKASQAMVDAAKPGTLSSELVAAFIGTVYKSGGSMIAPVIQLAVGPEHVHFSTPYWWPSGGKPYALKAGDVVQMEGMVNYAGLESQAQLTIALKPVPEVFDEIAPLATNSYRIAVENLKAGRTFGEVIDAVEAPLEAYNGWIAANAMHILNPNIAHSRFQINIDRSDWLGPIYSNRPLPQVTEQMRALKIEPGMTFTVEPSPGKGRNRVHVGGNLIVRKEGNAEELNKIGTQLVIV